MHCHIGHSSSTPHSLHFPNVTRESGWSNTVGSIVVVKSLKVHCSCRSRDRAVAVSLRVRRRQRAILESPSARAGHREPVAARPPAWRCSRSQRSIVSSSFVSLSSEPHEAARVVHVVRLHLKPCGARRPRRRALAFRATGRRASCSRTSWRCRRRGARAAACSCSRVRNYMHSGARPRREWLVARRGWWRRLAPSRSRCRAAIDEGVKLVGDRRDAAVRQEGEAGERGQHARRRRRDDAGHGDEKNCAP